MVARLTHPVLADLRRTRRSNRVAEIDWVDALYRAYLTGIALVVGVVALSGTVGDDELRPSQVARVLADGPAVIGLVLAVAVAIGVRSGGRGGPLALEAAEVRHVLLAPIPRAEALRLPALRQLRFAAFG